MTERGRHARRSGAGFYRDVLFLIAGILIVGAIVFGGLSVFAGRGTETTTTTTTTMSAAPPSTAESTTTTTEEAPVTTVPFTSPSSTEEAPSSTTTTIRQVRTPGEVRVQVLNSIDVVGLAAEITDDLAARGYQTLEPANYTPELSDTMIFHADGFSLEAAGLIEAIPDGTVAPDPELTTSQGADIVVVIGRSYQE